MRLIVDDFAIRGDRFENRSLVGNGNVDASFFDGIERSELNARSIVFAMTAVFGAGQNRQSAISALNIVRSDLRRFV